MTTATERLPVRLTKAQKESLARKARAQRLAMSELVRRAIETYDPADDARMLDDLTSVIRESTEEAMRAIDDTLEYVARSEKRIAELEASRTKGRRHGEHQ